MTITVKDIFLFVPNLIGYVRIFLALVSFFFMRTNYVISCTCYLLSVILDEFDGVAARLLNQESKFGAMLDLLTDCALTSCLIVVLAIFYPEYSFWLQLSLALNIVSHWLHMHVSLMKGNTSHKSIGSEGNPLMHLYYTSGPVLSVMCIGNELFFSMLYLLHFTEGSILEIAGINIGLCKLILYISAPIMVGKTTINVIQLVEASHDLASIDANHRNEKSE